MKYRRWPCPLCQQRGRGFALECPGCHALPWDSAASAGPANPSLVIKAGVGVEVRPAGFFREKQRFSMTTGFLGTLERRWFGRAEWLGVDGREWWIRRAGLITRTHLILENERPLAAAEISGWRGTHTLSTGTARWTLRRTGLWRHHYILETQDGARAAHLEGGWLAPVKAIRTEVDIPLVILVLASFFATRLRQTDVES